MPKINILDKSVYNLIAAGEVIDKPASVVKELLENSIDAGASNISIEIKEGGIDYIRVSDNGCGINEEDLQVAFMPHATSKIKETDDLYNIGTLGFRGEALSTITAVSKVTMITRTEKSDMGNMIKINGGEIEKIEPIGAGQGTTVIAEDLFYNIPARRKFLKKAKLEESEITNIVARIILSNPNIAINYTANDKKIYSSSGNGLFDAIYAIYGKSIVNNLVQVDFEKNGIKVWGYIGKVCFVKPNRTYQTLIVNGRYVQNQAISSAIYSAFENYIMKSTFPFFVLNLKIDNSLVDVNVHPNKLDVKFSNSKTIYETFLVEISKIILDSINVENVILTNKETISKTPEIDLTNLNIVSNDEGINYQPNRLEEQQNIYTKPLEVDISASSTLNQLYNHKTTSYDCDSNNIDVVKIKKSDTQDLREPSELEIMMSKLKHTQSKTEEQLSLNEVEGVNNQPNKIDFNYRLVGVLFDTYIMVQFKDYVYLIDQHAGHERILFDKYTNELSKDDKVYSQPLLIPFILNTNNLEFAYLEDNIEELINLGFEIEPFGVNKFRIGAVPVSLKDINLQAFFGEILSDLNTNRIKNQSGVLRDYLAKTACKHAIKAYDKLEESQINYLIEQLNSLEVLLCPHGRPIIVKLTEKEIEKWFKRIV